MTDGKYVRVFIFHLPDDSRRKERMIIYGDQLASGASSLSVPSRRAHVPAISPASEPPRLRVLTVDDFIQRVAAIF